MEKVIVSAPGKIILAGEHAVVYGYPAIVAAIDRRLTVSARRSLGEGGSRHSGLVKFALSQILKPGETVDLTINSQIPIGSGLGSSAALTTALVWALLPGASVKKKNKLVKIIEDWQHCQSSGVDQTIVREGGFLRFQSGEFRSINLPVKQAILIDSGRPKESTGDMVASVAADQSVFQQIGNIADHWNVNLIKANEHLLEKLGVVGAKAKNMIRKIEAGGGAVKICGAGGVKAGSGMLLAYHPNQAQLLQLIKQSGWHYLKVNLGAAGVRYER